MSKPLIEPVGLIQNPLSGDAVQLAGKTVVLASLFATDQWFVGTLNPTANSFITESIGMLDYGNYYAARTGSSANGDRRVLFAFTGWTSPSLSPSLHCGEQGVIRHHTFPRELGVALGSKKLTIQPVPETLSLRGGAPVNASLRVGSVAPVTLARGIRIEARLSCTGLDKPGASAKLSLLKPPSGVLPRAILELGYNQNEGVLYAAHSRVCDSCPPGVPVRQTAPVSLGPNGALELQVLVDAAVVEAFALPFVALTTLVDLSGMQGVESDDFSSSASVGGGAGCNVSSWPLVPALL